MSEIQICAAGQNGSNADAKPIPSIPPEVSAAAILLGNIPKQKIDGRRRRRRKWTGFINGQRCWQGRPVVLPDGRIGELQRALRDTATVGITPDGAGAASRLIVVPTNSLKLYRLPAAILLGQLKRGVVEKKSIRKAEAARLNGKMPARPGHRRRGRPRVNAPAWQRFVLKARNELRVNMSLDAMLLLVVRQRAELDQAIRAAAIKDEEKVRRTARLAGTPAVRH